MQGEDRLGQMDRAFAGAGVDQHWRYRGGWCRSLSVLRPHPHLGPTSPEIIASRSDVLGQ
jgi:hypothetical protein